MLSFSLINTNIQTARPPSTSVHTCIPTATHMRSTPRISGKPSPFVCFSLLFLGLQIQLSKWPFQATATTYSAMFFYLKLLKRNTCKMGTDTCKSWWRRERGFPDLPNPAVPSKRTAVWETLSRCNYTHIVPCISSTMAPTCFGYLSARPHGCIWSRKANCLQSGYRGLEA